MYGPNCRTMPYLAMLKSPAKIISLSWSGSLPKFNPLFLVQRCISGKTFMKIRSVDFTALHGTQTRSSDENSVRLSVRLSVKRVQCDKTEERSVQIFTPYKRSFSLVFWEEEWLVGATPSTWNFWSTGLRWSDLSAIAEHFVTWGC